MRLEEQKYATIDPAAEKVNQRERNILMQEHELHSLVFSRIYQRNTGKEVWKSLYILNILNFI